MKVRITGTKLEDATATYISLVDRGANRVPFRIVKKDKQENEMIDLSRVLKGVSGARKSAVAVMGLVVEKGADFEAVKKAILGAGFRVDKAEAFDGGKTVMFKQADSVDMNECKVIKMNSHLVAVVKGYDPYCSTSGMPFDDVVKAQGFFPSVSIAFDALRTTMCDTLMSAPAGGGSEMISKLEADLVAFKDYVMEQAKGLPAEVFKAANAVEAHKQSIKDQEKGKPAGAEDTEEEKKQREMDEAAEKAAKGDAGALATIVKHVIAVVTKARPDDAVEGGDKDMGGKEKDTMAQGGMDADQKEKPRKKPEDTDAATGADSAKDIEQQAKREKLIKLVTEAVVKALETGKVMGNDGTDAGMTDERKPGTPGGGPNVTAPISPNSTDEEVGPKGDAAKLKADQAEIKETLGTMAKALADVSKAVSGIAGQVTGIKEVQSTLATKVAGMEGTVANVQKAVKGVVLQGGDTAAGEGVRKQEVDAETSTVGGIDTAYDRTVRKSAFSRTQKRQAA